MTTTDDSPVRRRPDGSIDIGHYVAVAHRARSAEAKALRQTFQAALRELARKRGLGRKKPVSPDGRPPAWIRGA